jgi:SNF2 family DNA or RNA helicase
LTHDRPAIGWCHLNAEGDLLEKLIPDCVQVAGRHSDQEKEERLEAFTTGKVRVLITKQKIAGWGLNWQHCGDMAFFPSFSYEQYYQAVRRCYRFGRNGPVHVHNVSAPGESRVIAGLKKKQEEATRMFSNLVEQMRNELKMQQFDKHKKRMTKPAWLRNGELNGCH